MITATFDLLDLELNLTKRKRIAKMILRSQEHIAENDGHITYFNAAKKVAPPKTSKEYINFVAGLNETNPNAAKIWATELLR